jgi:hypothetical protein
MEFQIQCECGKSLRLDGSAAGATVGRQVKVPSLGELRRQAGLTPYDPDPALVISDMLSEGELPSSDACAGCGKVTREQVPFSIQCETIWKKGNSDNPWLYFLLFPFVGLVGVILLLLRSNDDDRVFGKNLIVRAPLRLCESCLRASLLEARASGAWKALMYLVPVVAIIVAWEFMRGWLAVVVLLLIPVVGLVAFVRQQKQSRSQTEWKRLLMHEPAYVPLLRKYPDALITMAEKRTQG